MGLSGTKWDYLGLYQTILDYLGLWDYLELSGIIWDYLRLSQTQTRAKAEAGESKILLAETF